MRMMGIDLGPCAKDVDFKLLKEKGISFVILKATQGDYLVNKGFPEKMEGALKEGLKVGLFHWCDPLVSAEGQAEYFLKNTAGMPYHFSAADIEQEWSDWQEWAARKISKFLSPKVISENGRVVTELLAEGSGRQVLVYSRASFVHDYARPMLDWMGAWPLWMAHYPYGREKVHISWEIFKENYLPVIENPFMPQGHPDWAMWQFTGDKFYLPGVDLAVDVDFFNGDVKALERFCGVAADLTPGSLKDTGAQPSPESGEGGEGAGSLSLESLAERVSLLEQAAAAQGWELKSNVKCKM